PSPGVVLGRCGSGCSNPQGAHENATEQAEGVGKRKHAVRSRFRQGRGRHHGKRRDCRGGGAGQGGSGCGARWRRRDTRGSSDRLGGRDPGEGAAGFEARGSSGVGRARGRG
ncbi:unnamed protein product, partial [Ectocarpus sp. 13 AM-2016]